MAKRRAWKRGLPILYYNIRHHSTTGLVRLNHPFAKCAFFFSFVSGFFTGGVLGAGTGKREQKRERLDGEQTDLFLGDREPGTTDGVPFWNE